jgi:integrase
MTGNELALDTERARIALKNIIQIWAATTTGPGVRRIDLMRDKTRSVKQFMDYVDKHLAEATPGEVDEWRQELERQGLAPVTVYAMLSKLSSFYKWAMSRDATREIFTFNPVATVRPDAPAPYQGDTVKALKPHQVKALLSVIKGRADAGDVVAKRDYAMLLFYFATGMRRSEIINLRWGDTSMDERNTITTKVKGGRIVTKEIADERPWRALFEYLEAAGRLETMADDTPLWARHDPHAPDLHAPLSAWGFIKNLKAYAREAEIGDIHLHQTRHTVAQEVAEEDGVSGAQEMLGHSNPNTTRIYVSRLTVRRDKHSTRILDDLLPD